MKCLSVFGDQAQKFAAEMLAIVEWGTQHWKLQESFPVPVVPKWLRTLEFIQTTMPVWGELPLVPPDTHYEDIRMRCPAVWGWMAVLLQFWQDHMTGHLFGGRFHKVSNLANTPDPGHQRVDAPLHAIRMELRGHTHLLWLDIQDQFAEEHLEEWEAQKCRTTSLNDLERDTKAVYRAHIIRGRTTRHALIVRRWPWNSCHLNDVWLMQKARLAPRPLKWT